MVALHTVGLTPTLTATLQRKMNANVIIVINRKSSRAKLKNRLITFTFFFIWSKMLFTR